jgi:hypothetical protein
LLIAAHEIVDGSNDMQGTVVDCCGSYFPRVTRATPTQLIKLRQRCVIVATTPCKPYFAANCKVSPTHDTVKKAVAEEEALWSSCVTRLVDGSTDFVKRNSK